MPVPAPLEQYGLAHRAVPLALSGLRVLQIADLHVRRRRGPGSALDRAIRAIGRIEPDLVFFCGDCMGVPGTEPVAARELGRVVGACRPRLGAFGVFGNNDSREMVRLARAIPGVAWLENRCARVETGNGAIRIIGTSDPEDTLRALVEDDGVEAVLTIGIAHHPTEIYAMEAAGVPVVFAGHTHGGQIRVGPRLAPHTSTDLPPHLASGVLRLRDTLCVVSRGLGEAGVELRANCRPQVPLVELVHGDAPGRGGGTLSQAIAW